MPRLKGETREVLGNQRWQSQLRFGKLRDKYMEPLIPFQLRDTSLPRTPSSGILGKRLRLRLSGQTLRRWGYLLDGEELVCLENKRKHGGKLSTGRLHETWDDRASVLVWFTLVSAVEITRGSAAALTVQAWFRVLLRCPCSECRLRPRSRSLWARISCRSMTCSRSHPHERPPSCCPSSSCRPLEWHQKRNIESRFILFLWVIIRCFNSASSSSSENVFFSSEQVCLAIATNCLTIQKNKDKNTASAMFLVRSVQCSSAVEGVCLHLPLPLKGRASLGHMFPLGPNKDVWDQNLQTPSHTFSNVAYSAFHTGIFLQPKEDFLLTANEANQRRTFPLTAQKAGLVPALALTLHLLGKVDGFLAPAALVSSSERHPKSKQDSPVFHAPFTQCVSAYVIVGSGPAATVS